MGILQTLIGEGAFTFPSYYSARYRRFVQEALINEGTFANDPDDVGGKTILGIASRYWKKDFKICMSYWKAKQYVEAIEYAIQFYHKNFYGFYYDQLHYESIAFKVFDFGINASPKKAVKFLQIVLNSKFNCTLTTDGIIGRRTIEAANGVASLPKLYASYIEELEAFYRSRKTFWKFGSGWLRRLRKVFN